MVNAIIIAGGKSIKGMEESGNKAVYSINGKMMVEYIIEALRSTYNVGKIVVVGPKDSLGNSIENKVDTMIDSDGTLMENVMEGVKYLGYNENILISTCDIPFITKEAVEDFIKNSELSCADLCYPIVEKKINDAKYPNMERSYVKLKEGRFTGGNLFYVNPIVVQRNFDFAEKLLSYRKKPIKMARLMSFNFVIRLLIGNININMIEKKFSEITGINAKAIVSLYPEIGQDVDKTQDVYAAASYLNAKV